MHGKYQWYAGNQDSDTGRRIAYDRKHRAFALEPLLWLDDFVKIRLCFFLDFGPQSLAGQFMRPDRPAEEFFDVLVHFGKVAHQNAGVSR